MSKAALLPLLALFLLTPPLLGGQAPSPAKLAESYAAAVRELNEQHARKPGELREAQLAKKLPAGAAKALEQLLAAKTTDESAPALAAAAEAALELDRVEDFDMLRARLARDSQPAAQALGVALSRPRVLLRGLGGLDVAYLERFAEVLEGILAAYDELFGFGELSKVPGKKLRVRVRLVEKITQPPHFAPEHPFHSEIDFPVADRERFTSPTADGKFLFYGLCHELGHVVAMWGDTQDEEDHHAWAHYTGVAVVEHLARAKPAPAWMAGLRDVKWRSLELEREAAKEKQPSLEDKAGVMALLLALHERIGPATVGAALRTLDQEAKCLRVNRVRYYRFAELKRALRAELAKDKPRRQALEELWP